MAARRFAGGAMAARRFARGALAARRFAGGAVALLAAALLLAGCATTGPEDVAPPPVPEGLPLALAAPLSAAGLAEAADLVDRRCVVCHGCYDAPCQLKLSSAEGVARGAMPVSAYDTTRATDAVPTRLGIDARGVPAWRALGFHDVAMPTEAGAPSTSLMARFLALGRAAPLAPDATLPEGVGVGPYDAQSCPAPEGFGAYAAANPQGGMPYGTAPLAEDEFARLWDWALSGQPLPDRSPPPDPRIEAQVAAWEAFLNGPSPRERLAARYVFEHLFLAHLHFEGDHPRRFFRLVRSATPPGTAIEEIATRRPLDDPGPAFSYRLRPVEETIVLKDHVVYRIGPDRLARLRELFLAPDWTVAEMPPWGAAEGNPFVTFAAIPAASRYAFLLDDPLFFVRTFIRGPVCHGQVATDVIEDRFWVAFLDPAWDLSVTDPGFLAALAPTMRLPFESAEGGVFDRFRPVLHDHQADWLRARDARYAASAQHAGGLPFEALWQGRTGAREPRLTVFRNHDSASVTEGFVGAVPETAWVIDYPLFERIYYDLVAGYDVFGSVEHQLATRLFMDHLRREGEDLFLSFLPVAARAPLHASWYRGPFAEVHAAWADRQANDTRPAAIDFRTTDPKGELLRRLAGGDRVAGDRVAGDWVAGDPVNRCRGADCAALPGAAAGLARLADREGPWVSLLPEVTVVRVSGPGPAEVFSLFRDAAHTNVALLAMEEARREPALDRVTVLRGQLGAYPNFVLSVGRGELPGMVDALLAMRGPEDWLEVVARHGVRRTGPGFWAAADALHEALAAQDPVEAGLLDLSRYADPGGGVAPR